MINVYKDLRAWARSLSEIELRAPKLLMCEKTSQMTVKRKCLRSAAIDKVPCHDCRVPKGELHLPSCDVEECLVCVQT
jgi:hypothetical protein